MEMDKYNAMPLRDRLIYLAGQSSYNPYEDAIVEAIEFLDNHSTVSNSSDPNVPKPEVCQAPCCETAIEAQQAVKWWPGDAEYHD